MTRRALRFVGWLLCTGAVLLVVVTVGRDVSSDRHAAQAQADLRRELARTPHADPVSADSAPTARPARAGHALAELRIPRFGASWSWIVVEGTAAADLAKGPGHYSGTPLPGEPGNVAIAGHRAGHGDPFLDFDILERGDVIELRQGAVVWRYTITTEPRIVPATASWVLDPLPGRQLTLTTCWPKYGSSKRMFVRAALDQTHGAPRAR